MASENVTTHQANDMAQRRLEVATQTKQSIQQANASGGAEKAEVLQSIFGLPPDNILPETNRKILDSMPICHFFPGTPNFTRGLDLFTIDSAWTDNLSVVAKSKGKINLYSYLGLLEAHGFRTPNSISQGIKVAFLADAFPTDTFTNEYGENFLQGLTDVGSEKAASLAQMMGTRTGTEALSKLLTPVGKGITGGVEKVGGETGKKAVSMIADFGKTAVKTMTEAVNATSMGQRAASLINKLAAGQRIDFPMVWKSSGFQPSYTMTVRLYNPNPRSALDTKKYIAGPITALLLLAVPITDDGSTYSWPFFHRIVAPGIFDLNPGFIANITVIKGGDQQQISQQQRMGIVDVRIDVGSLFSTMVAGGHAVAQKTRPTVRKYVNALVNPNPRRHTVYDRKGIMKKDEIASINNLYLKNRLRSQREVDVTLRGADQAQLKREASEEAVNRVDPVRKLLGDTLGDLIPEGLRVDIPIL